ncbi:hypothetical protein AKO1_009148 [Acrasis kona]|uniref:G-protein coupled receptors family 1 profile domain-containing protein n=1 Tax=Acrasis kona TaxID=1008807 RepID=A0AAW2ZL45_9EUKA
MLYTRSEDANAGNDNRTNVGLNLFSAIISSALGVYAIIIGRLEQTIGDQDKCPTLIIRRLLISIGIIDLIIGSSLILSNVTILFKKADNSLSDFIKSCDYVMTTLNINTCLRIIFNAASISLLISISVLTFTRNCKSQDDKFYLTLSTFIFVSWITSVICTALLFIIHMYLERNKQQAHLSNTNMSFRVTAPIDNDGGIIGYDNINSSRIIDSQSLQRNNKASHEADVVQSLKEMSLESSETILCPYRSQGCNWTTNNEMYVPNHIQNECAPSLKHTVIRFREENQKLTEENEELRRQLREQRGTDRPNVSIKTKANKINTTLTPSRLTPTLPSTPGKKTPKSDTKKRNFNSTQNATFSPRINLDKPIILSPTNNYENFRS